MNYGIVAFLMLSATISLSAAHREKDQPHATFNFNFVNSTISGIRTVTGENIAQTFVQLRGKTESRRYNTPSAIKIFDLYCSKPVTFIHQQYEQSSIIISADSAIIDYIEVTGLESGIVSMNFTHDIVYDGDANITIMITTIPISEVRTRIHPY